MVEFPNVIGGEPPVGFEGDGSCCWCTPFMRVSRLFMLKMGSAVLNVSLLLWRFSLVIATAFIASKSACEVF